MRMRSFTLVALALLSGGSLGCSRTWKRDPLPLPPMKLPDPQPPAPIVTAGAEEPSRTPAVKPPTFDIPADKIPLMPGLPKAKIPSSIPDSPPLAEPFEPIATPRQNVQPVKDEPKGETKKPVGKENLAEVRKLLDAAAKTYAGVPDYEAKLVRREVVGGKAMPTEEMTCAHRKEPFSVYLQVTGEAGKGREMLYVKGQNAGKLIVVTGKGDNVLLGTGKRMELDPDSSLITGKSRNRVTEAGMGKMLATIEKYVAQAEAGKRPADTVKFIGATENPQGKAPLTTIELVFQAGDEPTLPKGGSRTYGFDADKKSPAYGLPVLIVTTDDKGKEVEFYSFSGFKLPAKFTDADFSPDRLSAKKK